MKGLFTIKKGRHRATPLRFGIYWNKEDISRQVMFDHSAKYDIGPDQTDINKLFGIGFFPGHHKNSARFGWVYNPDKKKVELHGYWYDKGQRKIEYLCDVNFYTSYILTIDITYNYPRIRFTVVQKDANYEKVSKIVEVSRLPRLSYYLGLYFGGNRTAPHDINVTIKKV